MKPNGSEVSPIAYDLIMTFNEWLEESSKVGYRFSIEEQLYLEKMDKILNNQLDALVKYELERNKEN